MAALYEKKPDFAIIGHQDSWMHIIGLINNMRDHSLDPLPEEDIQYLYPQFPPRSLFRIVVRSPSAPPIHGAYIETFISPSELTESGLRVNIDKVRKAAAFADRLGTRIATLGGFTSIVLEGNIGLLPEGLSTKFTTGNTLTAAFITRGVEKALGLLGRKISECQVLIMGATGDIGSACTRYFQHKARHLFLVARNKKRLDKLSACLSAGTASHDTTTNYTAFLSRADVIIAVASTTGLELPGLKEGALIVDAGYPKNINWEPAPGHKAYLFHGGMGTVEHGYTSSPDYHRYFYQFPYPSVAHACVLEAMVLAFEGIIEPFSQGRGNITLEKMERIYQAARKHGIGLAPFFNQKGLWAEQYRLQGSNG